MSINRISNWCVNNKLSLNPGKYRRISSVLRSKLILFESSIDNKVIGRETAIRDVAVIFDDGELSFVPHISNPIKLHFNELRLTIRDSREFSYPQKLRYPHDQLWEEHLFLSLSILVKYLSLSFFIK